MNKRGETFTARALAATGALVLGFLASHLVSCHHAACTPPDDDLPGRASGDAPTPTPMTHEQLLAPLLEMTRGGEGRTRQELQRLGLNYDLSLAAGRDVATYRAGFPPDEELERRRCDRMEEVGASEVVTSIDQIVQDHDVAAALGKMLFWEMRVGSDGQTACASCHYRAGADPGLATATRPGEFGPDSVGVAVRLLDGIPGPDDDVDPGTDFESRAALRLMTRRFPHLGEDFEFLEGALQASRESLGSMIQAPVGDVVEELRSALAEAPAFADPGRGRRIAQTAELALERLERAEADCRAGDVFGYGEVFEGLAGTVRHVCDEHSAEGHDQTVERLARVVGRLDALSEEARLSTLRLNRGLFRAEIQHLAVGTDAARERQRTDRNAGSVIDAVMFDRLFHDGRAQSVFNGYDHLGDDAERDGIGKFRQRGGRLCRVLVRIPDAALASQSVVPPVSAREMSWYGRQFHHIARKLLDSRPLRNQEIEADDSLLAAWIDGSGRIAVTYRELVERAFRREWWCSSRRIRPAADEEHEPTSGDPLDLEQIEANFSLFWGLALQAYQERLVSDHTAFDLDERSLLDPDLGERARPPLVERGLRLLEQKCAECHALPEFSDAARSHVIGPLLEFEAPLERPQFADHTFRSWFDARRNGRPVWDEVVEWMAVEREDLAALGLGRGRKPYDNGFYNIGATDQEIDPGIGVAAIPPARVLNDQNAFGSGVPERLVAVWREAVAADRDHAAASDPLVRSTARERMERSVAIPRDLSLSFAVRRFGNFGFVAGAFKTPGLRNLALTGPWLHDGSAASLDEVLGLYVMPRFPGNRALHPAVPVEGFSSNDFEAVHAAFQHLVDPRVAREAAPFDHPSLRVPTVLAVGPDGRTEPHLLQDVPATGAAGR